MTSSSWGRTSGGSRVGRRTVTRSLYLPRSATRRRWRCFHTGAWYRRGTIEAAAPIDRLPLIRARERGIAHDGLDGMRTGDRRAFAGLATLSGPRQRAVSGPRRHGWKTTAFPLAWQADALTRITATLGATAEAIHLDLRREGEYTLPCDRARLVLPAGEKRTLDWTSQALELFA